MPSQAKPAPSHQHMPSLPELRGPPAQSEPTAAAPLGVTAPSPPRLGPALPGALLYTCSKYVSALVAPRGPQGLVPRAQLALGECWTDGGLTPAPVLSTSSPSTWPDLSPQRQDNPCSWAADPQGVRGGTFTAPRG